MDHDLKLIDAKSAVFNVPKLGLQALKHQNSMAIAMIGANAALFNPASETNDA